MRMDRKAEGSFAETMMAMMVVTIALTMFLTMFVHSQQTSAEWDPDISTDFADGLRLENGEITGIDASYLEDECTRKGFSSMVVIISTAGPGEPVTLRLGEPSETEYTYVSGMTVIPCDDGTAVPATYEVVAFA